MSDVLIAEFEAGRPAEGVYAVVRKQRRHAKSGDPYLVVELSDSSGSIEGRVWRDADWFDRNVREGDRVRAVGKAADFQGTLQFDIRRLDRVDAGAAPGAMGGEPATSYVPAGRRSTDDLAGELDFLVDELVADDVRALVEAVWRGPLRDDLLRSPATDGAHHAHLGGLVEHTIAVAVVCAAAADRHERLDRDVLVAAALLHDVGRVRELRSEGVIESDRQASLVGHVLLGHELLLEAAARAGRGRSGGPIADEAWWPRLVHAIATHHGPSERCRTREALVLQSANALDARLAGRDAF